jgi:prepilin-type N-terminal cleavage/methylation domain-containing protein/prepilin-type processing-associated H-X9-DG protein
MTWHCLLATGFTVIGNVNKRTSMKQKTAFTLVELLVVISVISLLMAIMVPVLGKARQQGQSVMCLSNLRQMFIAAVMYSNNNDNYFPMAYITEKDGSLRKSIAWDFTNVNNSGQKYIEPGLLWQDEMMERIQQCPSFKGKTNWMDDPYTGYNYNTSYIGGSCAIKDRVVLSGTVITSARTTDVRKPESCAIFGDGQWADGANKFMRSPFPGPHDEGFSGNWAGTQGYRHLGSTNVAYCDGSVKSVQECHKGADPANIAEGTGFLSEDNSAYDLK